MGRRGALRRRSDAARLAADGGGSLSPSKRIGQILRAHTALEKKAIAEQLRLLGQLRKALIEIMSEATRYRLFHLSQVLIGIDQEIARLQTASRAAVDASARTSFTLGDEAAQAAIAVGGIESFAGVSSDLLASALEVTNSLVHSIWAELGTGLKNGVRRVTLGITDPYEAMKQVTRLIRDPKTFGRAETRAEVIVRTEVNRIFSVATNSRMQQSAAALGDDLKKAWLTAGDSRVREAHRIAGEEYRQDRAIPMEQPFVVNDEELMFPLDPRGSAGNTINCRCFAPGTIVRGAALAVSKAFYAGPMWRLETARGHRLTVTPNHPVLTARGWLPAQRLHEGDYLLSDRAFVDPVTLGVLAPNHEHGEARIEDLFESFGANAGRRSAVVGALDLHGDARRLKDRQIDLVFASEKVRDRYDAALLECTQYAALAVGGPGALSATLLPAQLHLGGGITERDTALLQDPEHWTAARSNDAGDRERADALSVEPDDLVGRDRQFLLRTDQPLELGTGPECDAMPPQRVRDRLVDAIECLRQIDGALAGRVAPDQLVDVRIETACYLGPVYDLQTSSGLVHSSGIITHNCKLLPVVVAAAAAALAQTA